MSTDEERYGIMKRSLEVLIEKLDSLKKDEPYWSTRIDAIRKDIDNDNIGVEGDTVELKLRSLKKVADESPQNTRRMASSKKVKDIQDALVEYRNAFADYHHHP